MGSMLPRNILPKKARTSPSARKFLVRFYALACKISRRAVLAPRVKVAINDEQRTSPQGCACGERWMQVNAPSRPQVFTAIVMA